MFQNASRCASRAGARMAHNSATGATPLTGCTLQASLKMRCDNSGADYAIYWGNVNGKLVVAGGYKSDAYVAQLKAKGIDKSWVDESEPFNLNPTGDGPVASVYNSGTPVLIPDVSASTMQRKDLADKYGIQQAVFEKFETGVVEYGSSKATWSSVPKVPAMPKAAIRKGFENLGASYCMYWAKDGDQFKVTADYVSDSRKKLLRETRGDDETFCSKSKGVTLDVNGDGPVATAFREGKEVTVVDTSVMKRAAEAKEFDIDKVFFVPIEDGVLEFGIPANVFMGGNTLAASLKMRCDTSGAGYALYWQHDPASGKLAISGSYVTPERQAVLTSRGKSSFAEASKGYTLDATGDGPVASVLKTQEPFYIQDVQTCDIMKRGQLTKEYGITSICFVAVPGGVLEYGVSDGPCTATWTCIEDARKAIMPKEELQKAFDWGATHCIFWHKVGDQYEVGASYVIPERVRGLKQARGDDKSYTSESSAFKLSATGEGPISTAARSGVASFIEDPATDPNFKRAALAKEFNIGQCHFVPCKDGVLEYGTGRLA